MKAKIFDKNRLKTEVIVIWWSLLSFLEFVLLSLREKPLSQSRRVEAACDWSVNMEARREEGNGRSEHFWRRIRQTLEEAVVTSDVQSQLFQQIGYPEAKGPQEVCNCICLLRYVTLLFLSSSEELKGVSLYPLFLSSQLPYEVG